MNATLKTVLLLGGGVVIGFLVGSARESSCCKRVAAGVRDELADQSPILASIYDGLNIGKYAPGLLDFFGVDA